MTKKTCRTCRWCKQSSHDPDYWICDYYAADYGASSFISIDCIDCSVCDHWQELVSLHELINRIRIRKTN